MYFIFIKDNKTNGCGQCRCLNEEITNYEVSEELYNSFIENPEMYIWDGEAVIVDPDYNVKQLAKVKQEKYTEAKEKAYMYLESGEALYEFETGKHIEATDGNIGKFTAYALKFMAGSTSPVVWSTKEDETVYLTAEQVNDILEGIGEVQAQIWTVQYNDYIVDINNAQTVEDVQAITINYEV